MHSLAPLSHSDHRHNPTRFLSPILQVKSSEFKLGLVQAKMEEAVDPALNDLESSLTIDYLKKTTRDLKSYSTEMLEGLKKPNPQQELDPLIHVKACLKSVYDLTVDNERQLAANQAALEFIRETSTNKELAKNCERMLGQVDDARNAWAAVLNQLPDTESTIAPITSIWEEKTEAAILAYTESLDDEMATFKKRPFWDYATGFREAGKEMEKAEYVRTGSVRD